MPSLRPSRAFSLVELVIVIVVMGIVASIAMHRMGDMVSRSRITATRESLRAVQATVEEEQAATGQWPTPLLASMFAGGVGPRNALLPTQRVAIEEVSSDATDPAIKATQDPSDAAFWYNRKLGIVRARVSLLASNADTLALYNSVNGTNAASLGAGTDGGGGATGGGGLTSGATSIVGIDE